MPISQLNTFHGLFTTSVFLSSGCIGCICNTSDSHCLKHGLLAPYLKAHSVVIGQLLRACVRNITITRFQFQWLPVAHFLKAWLLVYFDRIHSVFSTMQVSICAFRKRTPELLKSPL